MGALKLRLWYMPMEGVIIECPLKDLFDNVIVIITAQMAVRELDDDDDESSSVVQKCRQNVNIFDSNRVCSHA